VVNLSVSAGIAESYANSPIDAAVERLWHDRVAVVTAAGNLGTDEDATWYAPGNDPMVITVGCLDENHTRTLSDDSLCAISSRGVTQDGFAKPDLVAPGRRIVSTLATGSSGRGALLGTQFTDRITGDGAHIRLSGTSMAASVVSGAIALLLEAKPDLRPDQVKRLLTTTSRAYPGKADNAGMLDVARALQSVGRVSSSVQIPMPASGAAAPAGKSTLLWDGGHWANAYFDGARWSTAYADGAHWDAGFWDGARWASVYGDGARWSEGGSLDGARWGEIANWDSSAWSDVGAYD
jgi:serine protease AprX